MVSKLYACKYSLYPSDHCGILRVKDKNTNTKYLSFVLEQVGKKANFNRTFRASLERIKTLKISLPSLDTQNKVINVIENVEARISKLKTKAQELKTSKTEILSKALELKQ